MSTRVHILMTVPKPEATEAAALVFRTVRVGFPQAQLWVHGNGANAGELGIELVPKMKWPWRWRWQLYQAHDAWLEGLIMKEEEPFWVCDTDMVFFGAVEHFQGDCLAGRLEPTFEEEWTQSIHVERLHTCLLWIHPARLRAEMRRVSGDLPKGGAFLSTAQTLLVRQTFVPRREGKKLFYDTAAGLWQAGLGQVFPPGINQAFEHLHCGSYAPAIASQTEGLKDLPQVHRAVFEDCNRARGLHQQQEQWYQQHAVNKERLYAI